MTRGDNPSSTCAGQSPGYAGLAALELSAMTVPVTRDGLCDGWRGSPAGPTASSGAAAQRAAAVSA